MLIYFRQGCSFIQEANNLPGVPEKLLELPSIFLQHDRPLAWR